MTTANIKEIYQKEFPSLANEYDLKDFQSIVIGHINQYPTAVAIMPTGGGKSLIYWMSARVLEGTCLVISPLIALIDEQAEKLIELGFKVLVIHGRMGASEQVSALTSFAKGENVPDFIFVSPERLATDGYFEYCISQQHSKIKLVVIDEIHCVSQWGFDFRPFYKHIPAFLNRVYHSTWPKVLGLTATINPKELHDISKDFKISKDSILRDDVLLRFDINIHVEKLHSEEVKTERLWEILSSKTDEKTLVYLYRKYYKHGVEDLNEKAIGKGFSSAYFHGDMSGTDRQDVIRRFKENEISVVFATNAFGMGIDIPDIRNVIHYMLPESIEQFYQEIGRAGRDKLGAESYILYSNKNIDVRRRHFIDGGFSTINELDELFKRATNNKLGRQSLQYFAEEKLQSILTYFLESNVITIDGKGFTSLNLFNSVSSTAVQDRIDLGKTGIIIPILRKPPYDKQDCREFFFPIYEAVVSGNVELKKNFDKCLIIFAHKNVLSDKDKELIEEDIEVKKSYKHDLLDYLVFLLDNFEDSKALHQEIGRYLGIDKHKLGKIHETESGDWVRSKSEVIIANILFRSDIPFEYEKKLFYESKKWKEPDFTIDINGQTWYWEHLGMLGDEEYNEGWREKKEIFERMGIMDQVITTKESSVLSKIANEKVQFIKSA